MIADIVEDSELKTGRRSEGLFFSAQTFAKKSVSGLGALFAGLMLSTVGFPSGTRPDYVDPETIRHLAILYVPTMLAVYGIGIFLLTLYKIDRKQHEENLSRLKTAQPAVPIPAFAADGKPVSAAAVSPTDKTQSDARQPSSTGGFKNDSKTE